MKTFSNLDVLTNQELSEIKGGTWFGDAFDWISENISRAWEWLTKHGDNGKLVIRV